MTHMHGVSACFTRFSPRFASLPLARDCNLIRVAFALSTLRDGRCWWQKPLKHRQLWFGVQSYLYLFKPQLQNDYCSSKISSLFISISNSEIAKQWWSQCFYGQFCIVLISLFDQLSQLTMTRSWPKFTYLEGIKHIRHSLSLLSSHGLW